MLIEAPHKPLTNVQLELLKAFAYNVSDDDISVLRDMLSDFFATRAISYANKAWDEQKWDDNKVEKLLKTKLRKRSNA
jgi:hypothetical protein